MDIRQIEYGSAEYHQLVALRQAVLRTPLGLVFSTDDLQREVADFHFAVFEGKQVVAGGLLSPVDDATIKLRQFAVLPEQQGHGLGAKLLAHLETFAQQHGAKEILMHARENAIPFYEKYGYTREGERFIEVTIPHWRMRKKLAGE